MSGAFVAVVGPSGSGKDSVIGFARERLASRPEFLFPRRVITRPSGPGEDHMPATDEGFAAADAAGRFTVTWRAHGLAYGLPAELEHRVARGAVAVANVSRGAIDDIGQRFERVRVVHVSVPEEVRLARIVARGREDHSQAATRVARPDPAPDHPRDLEIVNDGPLDEAGTALVGFLTALLARA